MMVKKNGVEFKACSCGCGEAVSPKSLYKPGHDARHAGQIGREAAALVLAGSKINLTAPGLYVALPTEHLRAKAERIAQNALAKVQKKEVGGQKAVVVTKVVVEGKFNHFPGHHSTCAIRNLEACDCGIGSLPLSDNQITEIKVGRWTYPARMTRSGKLERNTKRDGSGSWVSA